MELQHHATVVLHQFHIRVPDLLIFSAADGQHLPTGQRDFIVSDAPDEAVIEQVSLVNPQKALGRQFFSSSCMLLCSSMGASLPKTWAICVLPLPSIYCSLSIARYIT